MTPLVPKAVVQLMDSTSGLPVIYHLHRNAPGSAEEWEWREEQAGRYVFEDHLVADQACVQLLADERARREADGRPFAKLKVYPFIVSGPDHRTTPEDPGRTAPSFGTRPPARRAVDPATVYARTSERLGEHEELEEAGRVESAREGAGR